MLCAENLRKTDLKLMTKATTNLTLKFLFNCTTINSGITNTGSKHRSNVCACGSYRSNRIEVKCKEIKEYRRRKFHRALEKRVNKITREELTKTFFGGYSKILYLKFATCRIFLNSSCLSFVLCIQIFRAFSSPCACV